MLSVILTKHAFERLFERFEKRPDLRVISNVVESVLRDGLVIYGKRDIKVITSNYTFCCVFDNEKLVIKTVIRTKEIRDKLRNILKFAKKSDWRNIYIENRKQIERWCREAERLKNVCRICGISREQTRIERCKIYGFYVCRFCCEVIGYGSEKCVGCAFYSQPKKFEGVIEYVF